MQKLLFRVSRTLLSAGTLGLPMLVLAADPNTDYFTGFISELVTLVNAVIPVLLTLGLLIFLWGLVKFLTSAGNEDAASKAKSIMIWGIIGLFVMVTVWGLVAFLNQITGIDKVETATPVTGFQ